MEWWERCEDLALCTYLMEGRREFGECTKDSYPRPIDKTMIDSSGHFYNEYIHIYCVWLVTIIVGRQFYSFFIDNSMWKNRWWYVKTERMPLTTLHQGWPIPMTFFSSVFSSSFFIMRRLLSGTISCLDSEGDISATYALLFNVANESMTGKACVAYEVFLPSLSSFRFILRESLSLFSLSFLCLLARVWLYHTQTTNSPNHEGWRKQRGREKPSVQHCKHSHSCRHQATFIRSADTIVNCKRFWAGTTTNIITTSPSLSRPSSNGSKVRWRLINFSMLKRFSFSSSCLFDRRIRLEFPAVRCWTARSYRVLATERCSRPT